MKHPDEIETEFPIRSYGKSELALRYMPHLRPETAARILRRWIRTCPHLQECLMQTGYTPTQKLLTPLQVKYIVEHLGTP